MSCPFHHEPPPDSFCRYCDEGTHVAYEAARIDWVNRCPQCKGSEINLNELEGYKWCGNCGAQSIRRPVEPTPIS